jgi:hypothetical protein
MPTARYTFTRDNGINGFGMTNTAATDAINALEVWIGGQTGRRYVLLDDDDDEKLAADLTWHELDDAAGSSLDAASRQFGIDRIFNKP